MFGENLMEEICERSNLEAALRRVRANRGGPGVDGMTVDELPGYLKANWRSIKEQLLSGEYQPRAVKGVEIPKPGRKGKRRLGIPCVIDRFIEQAMLQVLQRQWDRRFSDSSYGYRPGRSAHQAVARAQDYVKAGYGTVVDLDLEKFFDRSSPRSSAEPAGAGDWGQAGTEVDPRVSKRGDPAVRTGECADGRDAAR